MNKSNQNQEDGFILVCTLSILVLLSILMMSVLSMTSKNVVLASQKIDETISFYNADAGVYLGSQILIDEHEPDTLRSAKFNLWKRSAGNVRLVDLIGLSTNGTNSTEIDDLSHPVVITYNYLGVADGNSLDMSAESLNRYEIYSLSSTKTAQTFIKAEARKYF